MGSVFEDTQEHQKQPLLDEVQKKQPECSGGCEVVVFIGNPGVGKSTLFNTYIGADVSRCLLEEGTRELIIYQKDTDDQESKQCQPIIIDTPGLFAAEDGAFDSAAEHIIKALHIWDQREDLKTFDKRRKLVILKSSWMRLVFVIKLIGLRVQAYDVVMIQTVLKWLSRNEVSYSIIVNECKLKEGKKEEIRRILLNIFSTIKGKPSQDHSEVSIEFIDCVEEEDRAKNVLSTQREKMVKFLSDKRYRFGLKKDKAPDLNKTELQMCSSEEIEAAKKMIVAAEGKRKSQAERIENISIWGKIVGGYKYYERKLMYSAYSALGINECIGKSVKSRSKRLSPVVDRTESALVVAPTSSGKTFVSCYTMKQAPSDNKTIKRSIDRSIIVYVAPTKALVNQVSAALYARYGKVFGVMTLGYSVRLEECKVLITIPECLKALLLSPESEAWTRCIKYVVLHDVHLWEALKTVLYGSVSLKWWDVLSLLCRQPLWIQQTHNRKINLIMHRTRWSDLIEYPMSY